MLQRSRSLRSECHTGPAWPGRSAEGFNEVAPFGASATGQRCFRDRLRQGFNEVAPFGASATTFKLTFTERKRALQRSRSLRSECHPAWSFRSPCPWCFNEVAPFGASATGMRMPVHQMLRWLQRSRSLRSECHRCRDQGIHLVGSLQRSRSLRSECHHFVHDHLRQFAGFNEVAPFGASATHFFPVHEALTHASTKSLPSERVPPCRAGI